MKKLSLIFFAIALFLSLLYFALQKDLSFYQITCGEGDNEVQYIATKKVEDKYLVLGELREFPNCRVDFVKGQ